MIELATPDKSVARSDRGSERPWFVITEGAGGPPDEAYRIFSQELGRGLNRRYPAFLFTTGEHSADGMQRVKSGRPFVSLELCREIYRRRPEVIFYVYPATLMALLRGRILRLLSPGSRLVLVALQPTRLKRLTNLVLRMLLPDLILVTTEAELRTAALLGARAERIGMGVDTARFRPPEPGEKAALREKLGLPAVGTLVLHVGHLRKNRNMGVLGAIARRPNTTAIALVSQIRTPESANVRADLERRGVLVLDGYRPAVEELYRAVDCYVFPVAAAAGAIAMPLSVLEALACDVPVVTTRFGALPEHFSESDGLRYFATEAELLDGVERVLEQRSATRHLVAGHSWEATVDRIVEMLETEKEAATGAPRPSQLELASAVAWRQLWKYDDRLRTRFWSATVGFARRSTPKQSVSSTEPRAEARPTSSMPASLAIGLLSSVDAGATSAVARAARLYGAKLMWSETGANPSTLVDNAIAGGWPLLTVSLEEPADRLQLQGGCLPLFKRFLAGGGTLFLNGIVPASGPALEEIGSELGIRLPAVLTLPAPATAMLLSGTLRELTAELAGLRIEGAELTACLAPSESCQVLVWAEGRDYRRAVSVILEVGGGRLVLSAGSQVVRGRLSDAFGPAQAPALLPAMMLIRSIYGEGIWHAPFRLANLTIDDPALRPGLLGMDFNKMGRLAEKHHFHATVATIPSELRLASAAVLGYLHRHPAHLSACYHGNDHRGYEFYVAGSERTRFRRWSLARQLRALETAAESGRQFAARAGFALDRVMVFPHGIGPAELLPRLGELGFLASCNWLDRYPLGASPPPDPDLGMRPADLAWGGFPLLWRRAFSDQTFAFDFFIGRPAITFAHPTDFSKSLDRILETVAEINEVGDQEVTWLGLEEIAKHAYLHRRGLDGGWDVLMTGNETCLHNAGTEARTYRVLRPQRPDGALLEGAGMTRDADEIEVTVAPQSTTVVKLVGNGRQSLPGDSPCQLSQRGSADRVARD